LVHRVLSGGEGMGEVLPYLGFYSRGEPERGRGIYI